jgi:hypothetical protein
MRHRVNLSYKLEDNMIPDRDNYLKYARTKPDEQTLREAVNILLTALPTTHPNSEIYTHAVHVLETLLWVLGDHDTSECCANAECDSDCVGCHNQTPALLEGARHYVGKSSHSIRRSQHDTQRVKRELVDILRDTLAQRRNIKLVDPEQ